MTRLTRIITLTLALLITVTSQQMVSARGMMKDASGQVILCTGQGLVTVTLDQQGNPMEPVHICPDCALTFVGLTGAEIAAKPVVIHIQTLTQTTARAWQKRVVPTVTQARGPPLFT